MPVCLEYADESPRQLGNEFVGEGERGGPQREFCEADGATEPDLMAVEQLSPLPPDPADEDGKRGGPQRMLCVAVGLGGMLGLVFGVGGKQRGGPQCVFCVAATTGCWQSSLRCLVETMLYVAGPAA